MLLNIVVAAPLVLWLSLAIFVASFRALDLFASGGFPLAACAQVATAVFFALVIVFLLIRRPPLLTAKGFAPKVAGAFGCVLPFFVLPLPRAALGPTMAAFSSTVTLLGTAGSIYAIYWLGRSFSILPQARGLVTAGPYARIRHPLYLAELLVLMGGSSELAMPWPFVVGVIAVGVQLARMHYEEQVLAEAFPAYRDYATRTSRLIPGLY